MIGKSLASVAALVCFALPAHAQDFPVGPGKDTVVGVCGGCHDINRLTAADYPSGPDGAFSYDWVGNRTGEDWGTETNE